MIVAGFTGACTVAQTTVDSQLDEDMDSIETDTAEPGSQATVTPFSTAESTPTEAAVPITPTSADLKVPDCKTESLVFFAVNDDLQTGIHILCLGSKQVVTLVEDKSEMIELGWCLMDFDVSFTGERIVFATSQGSSIQGQGRIYSIDLSKPEIALLHEESSMITEVVFSPDEDVIGFIIST